MVSIVVATISVGTLLAVWGLWELLGQSPDLNGVPRIEVGGRVTDVLNGEHFDDLLQDTPDALRPPSLVLFLDSRQGSCMRKVEALAYRRAAETRLPARERLMVAKYDMGFDRERVWYQWTHEKDLPRRFNISRQACPTLVFVPRKCNGWTKWCQDAEGNFGCEGYTEQCSGWEVYQPSVHGANWVQWALERVEREGEPSVSRALGSYAKQGQWLLQREACTTHNHQRNLYIFPEIPLYTRSGFEAHRIPDTLYKELMDYYHRWEPQRYTEEWDTWGSTQINFHEAPTTMVSLDFDMAFRTRIANFVQPLLAAWSNQTLSFSSFYGIRSYPEFAFLHPHLDRIDTHVISATFSLAKLNVRNASDPSLEWPLRVVEPRTGRHRDFVHPPGTLLFYESSKVIHGRPTRNPVGGGQHLGCFIHYSVADGEYELLKERAKARLDAFQLKLPYRSTESVEPSRVEWFDMATKNLNTFRTATATAKQPDTRQRVTFENDLDIPLHLYWVGPAPAGLVSQGVLNPKDKLEENTEQGHRFLWSVSERKEGEQGGQGAVVIISPTSKRLRSSAHKQHLLHDAQDLAHDL